MPKITGERVVILVDMDCFYCQVEEKLDPELKGKPIAVVQYNQWKGGGIIAVNYVARAMGVSRHMRGDEAREKCPDIRLPQVPCSRGKADTSKYRDAGKEVAKVLQSFTSLVERASVDEAYMDITQLVEEEMKTTHYSSIQSCHLSDSHVLGHGSVEEFISVLSPENDSDLDFDVDILHSQKILVGAYIAAKIRKAVFDITGYTCSAGIGHNKILAKLVCGMNKPNKQTLLPKHSINLLFKTLDLKKVKSLGGKFGDTVCETLKIKKMAELQKFSEKELQHHFEPKHGIWLYNIARGMDSDPVTPRYVAKSIGCCKNFKGKTALQSVETLTSWLSELAKEIEERLENDTLDNNRIPRQIVVSFSQELSPNNDVSSSRSYNFLTSDNLNANLFSSKALELIKCSTNSFSSDNKEDTQKLAYPIKFLGLSIGKFDNISDTKKSKSIQDLFNAQKEKLKITSKCNLTQNKATDLESIGRLSPILRTDLNCEDIILKSTSLECNLTQKQVTDDENISRLSPILKTTLNREDVILKSTDLCDQESFFNKYFQKHSSSSVEKEFINPKPAENFNCQINGNIQETASTATSNNVLLKTKIKNFHNYFQKQCSSPLENELSSTEPTHNVMVKDNNIKAQCHLDSTKLIDFATTSNGTNFNQCNEHENDSNDSVSSIDLEINLSRQNVDQSSSLERQYKIEQMRGLLNNSLPLYESDVNVYKDCEDEIQVYQEPGIVIPEPCQSKSVVCGDCHEHVPENELGTHNDYHLALRLVKEDKSLLQHTVSQNRSAVRELSSKRNTKKGKDRKSDIKPISKFFAKAQPYDVGALVENCKECGRMVPLKDFPEHLDFHEAKKLHQEINFDSKRKMEMCTKAVYRCNGQTSKGRSYELHMNV